MSQPGNTPVQMFKQGIVDLLNHGYPVPSVLGDKSKASNFGCGDRPWIELTAYKQDAVYESPTIFSPSAIPLHVPYAIGLLAWTLGARNDVATLAYYRDAARDFSDDGATLCGAFGRRLWGPERSGQVDAIVRRLRRDPTSRRTFASIIADHDNVTETLEYPCASGVQLFLRGDKLHWLTVMRAQQALTVLPYDAFLFSTLQHFVASELGIQAGGYTHFSGTFHIYQNESNLAQRAIKEIVTITLPMIPPNASRLVADELISIEERLRLAAEQRDIQLVKNVANGAPRWEFNAFALNVLSEFATAKINSFEGAT